MKIALIISALNIQGGGQRQALQLLRQLKKRGHQVVLFTSEFNPQNCYQQLCSGLDIRSLSEEKRVAKEGSRLLLFSQLKDLLNIVRIGWRVYKWKPDIVNPHEWPANWMGIVVNLLNGGKTPVVWTANDFWYIYNPLEQKGRFAMYLRRFVDVWIVDRFVDKIVVLDYRLQRLARQLYRQEAKVIRSGIETDRFKDIHICRNQRQEDKTEELRQSLGVNKNTLLLLSVSVFFRHRRFEDVIFALRNLREKNRSIPSFKYVIVGEKQGDLGYYRIIKNLIKFNKLERDIEIIGESVSEKDLLNFYFACDIFIFPNNKQTWGLAPLEAMAVGKPCIVSRGAGVHEVLTDGENALLVEPQKPQQLSKKLLLLMQDRKLRQKLGKKSRKFVLNSFSWEKYASDMEKMFGFWL